MGAYGGFFIPKSYGSSIAATGGPELALWIRFLPCAYS
jgi:NNP family nitrate/nitrite transporter-like MFS transporter